ncbi:MAG: OsmC family protein [Burkholderiaceae bacterium]
MAQDDTFEGSLSWQGQPADRPFTYETIERSTRLEFPGGAAIDASAPSQFMGDDSRANPETLMLGSLMQCHFLTFMAVAAKSGATVLSYDDSAVGKLGRKDNGKTGFVSVTLRPRVELDAAHQDRLADYHERAHRNCFMSNSVNFPVTVEQR